MAFCVEYITPAEPIKTRFSLSCNLSFFKKDAETKALVSQAAIKRIPEQFIPAQHLFSFFYPFLFMATTCFSFMENDGSGMDWAAGD